MRRHGWFYSAGMEQYVIRGGQAGYDRLKVLARARWPGTAALLDRVGVQPGQRCLDLGCGGGDVTLELARMVGPDGQVTGVDMDEVKLDLARRDAAARGLGNVSFQALNVYEWSEPDSYDLVYSRNVLQHLSRPVDVLASMWAAVRPGGVIVVEDADFEGSFCNPPNDGFAFWVEAYQRVLERRGGDPLSGRKLFQRFGEAAIPMDEALARAAVDFGGRGCLVYLADHLKGRRIGDFDAELAREFFAGFASSALCNLHMEVPYGENAHHILEALFKAFARALRSAVAIDPREASVPSTKGTLTA